MPTVKLLTNDFMPNWQAGISVNIDEPELSKLLKENKVELLEPLPVEEPPVELVVVDEKTKKSKKKVS